MSRTYRDAKGGHASSKYFITHEGVAKFKRYCRHIARHKAKQALRQGEEPHHTAQSNIFAGIDDIGTQAKGGGMEEQLAYMLELNAYLDDWAIP